VVGRAPHERFVRKVSRITLEWSVEAQSLIDARERRWAKAVRRLRRHDAELASRLEAGFERTLFPVARRPYQSPPSGS
jgi:hypothetical protein